MQLSKYFSEREFLLSETARINKINNTWESKEYLNNAIWLCSGWLDDFRQEVGMLRVSSGYRCPELNKIVGGSKNSAHCFGLAADLVPLEEDIHLAFDKILNLLRKDKLEWDQIIFEEPSGEQPWIHFGLRKDGMRKQILHCPKNGVYLPITKAPYKAVKA